MRCIFLLLCSLTMINACKEPPTEAVPKRVTNVLWEQTSLDSLRVETLASSGTNLFAGTSAGIFRSTNGGTSWLGVNHGLPSTPVYSIAVIDSDLFAGTQNGVFRSNNGTSWIAAGLSGVYFEFELVVLGTTVVAYVPGMRDGCCGSVFSTIDNGQSWKVVTTPDEFYGVATFAVSGPRLFAGSKGVFRSIDAAESWTRISPDTILVNSLLIAGSNLYAGATYGSDLSGERANGVFRSSDNGLHWTLVSAGLPNTHINHLVMIDIYLFAGTDDGVFVTPDSGMTWIGVNAGLAGLHVYALVSSGRYLFAGTEDGVFKGTIQ